MFDHDCAGQPDEAALIAEGRRRVHVASPALTDEQFRQWLTDVRKRGGRLVLVPGGVMALYDRPLA